MTDPRMPAAIAAVVGGAAGEENHIGMSSASVRMYPAHVLKMSPVSPAADREAEILTWLGSRDLPVPRVAARAQRDGVDWLLMTRIPGRMLCDPSVMNNPTLLLDCLAEALHLLWRTPVGDCPFDRSWHSELDAAEACIRAGRFNAESCEPETFGPGGFRDPMDLLEWLRKNAPEETRVLSHGDCCLPNLFTDGSRFSGMIDLGDFGTADPWRDLSYAWRSLKHNSDGFFGKTYPNIDPDDLFRAVGVPKDGERLRLYLLFDELF